MPMKEEEEDKEEPETLRKCEIKDEIELWKRVENPLSKACAMPADNPEFGSIFCLILSLVMALNNRQARHKGSQAGK